MSLQFVVRLCTISGDQKTTSGTQGDVDLLDLGSLDRGDSSRATVNDPVLSERLLSASLALDESMAIEPLGSSGLQSPSLAWDESSAIDSANPDKC